MDELGGKTIFAIGSLVKLFINLAYCLVITRNEIDGVDWNVKAYKLYNKICDARNEPRIPELERNPTLKELLLHKNGFAPMISGPRAWAFMGFPKKPARPMAK